MIAVFLSRLSSTLVLWGVVLWTIFSGYAPGIAAVIALMGLMALWEFYAMLGWRGDAKGNEGAGLPSFRIVGMLCGVALFAGVFWSLGARGLAGTGEVEAAILAGSLLLIVLRQLLRGLDAAPAAMAYTLFGLLYVAWLFTFMNKLVYVTPRSADGAVTGQFYVLYLMVVTKFSDMGAYLTGTAIGKHPMAPRISPKKTWEGFFGALGFSLLGSYGMLALLGSKLPHLNAVHAGVLGLALGFAAILGDLAESLLKRATGVKDSGRLLPGIGGALDLIDSLLFTAPLLYFYLRCLPNPL